MKHSFTGRRIAALRIADEEKFVRVVRAALERAHSIPAAADVLGVSRATLFRWIAGEPAIRAGISLPPVGAPSRETAGKQRKTRFTKNVKNVDRPSSSAKHRRGRNDREHERAPFA